MTARTQCAAALACFSLLLLGAPARARTPRATEPGRHVLEGSDVAVHNIAGEMRIVEGTGRSVVVEVTAGGRDADRLTVETGRDEHGRNSLWVVYPERKIVYPRHGDEGSHSTFDYRGRRHEVTGHGSGLEAHADLLIRVPKGQRLQAFLSVGHAAIVNVDGAISFDGASASVEAERVAGSLSVDLGSGDVIISRSNAAITVDTGSGNITLSEVQGDISADAGSGDVVLRGVGSERITIDSGSGTITGSNIRATKISADCGSGEIDLDGAAVGSLALQAGSGSVHLKLTQNIEQLAISTGSGSVKLEAPRDLSARFRIECPKRNLHIGFPTQIERGEDDLTVGTIGSGRGKIDIEAGSGNVVLVRM
jgi:hypothetical protein